MVTNISYDEILASCNGPKHDIMLAHRLFVKFLLHHHLPGAALGKRPLRVLVSPRNELKSRKLAEEFPGVVEIAR